MRLGILLDFVSTILLLGLGFFVSAIVSVLAGRLRLRFLIPFIAWIAILLKGGAFIKDGIAVVYFLLFIVTCWFVLRSIYIYVLLRKIDFVEQQKDKAWSALFTCYLFFYCMITSFPFTMIQKLLGISLHSVADCLIGASLSAVFALIMLQRPLQPYKKLKRQLKRRGFTSKSDLAAISKAYDEEEQASVYQYLVEVTRKWRKHNKITEIISENKYPILVSHKLMAKLKMAKAALTKNADMSHRQFVTEFSAKSGVPQEVVASILAYLHGSSRYVAAAVESDAAWEWTIETKLMVVEDEHKSALNHTTIAQQNDDDRPANEDSSSATTTNSSADYVSAWGPEDTTFGMLRLQIDDHPLRAATYEIRSSYYRLLSFVIEELIAKYQITSQYMKLYARLLDLAEEDVIRLSTIDDSQDRRTLDLARKTIKKTHYTKMSWFRFAAHRYKYTFFADLAYLQFRLEGQAATTELMDALGRSLSIKQKEQEEITLFCKELVNGEGKAAQLRLNEKKNAKFREELEFLCRRVRLNFELERKPRLHVAVVATMSAGKSTLLNALMGSNLFPSKNQACTAKITSFQNNDAINYVIGHTNTNGREQSYSSLIDSSTVAKWNGLQNNERIYLEGSLQGIRNQAFSVTLYDTPGTNYSQDRSHQETTYQFLMEQSVDTILYVLNATQFGTEDDKMLLQQVVRMKLEAKRPLRLLFLFNKVDEYDIEGNDDIAASIANVVSYLEGAGVENPTVIPVSSYGAKLFRMALAKQELSKKEASDFRFLFRFFIEDGIDLNTYAIQAVQFQADHKPVPDEQVRIGEKTYSSSEIQTALHRTGLLALENQIENMLM